MLLNVLIISRQQVHTGVTIEHFLIIMRASISFDKRIRILEEMSRAGQMTHLATLLEDGNIRFGSVSHRVAETIAHARSAEFIFLYTGLARLIKAVRLATLNLL